MRTIFTLVSLSLLPCLAAAQATNERTVQPERPTVATHAHTVAPGLVEIETGLQGDRAPGGRVWSSPTVTKVGLGSHLQLNLYTPLYFASGARTSSGAGDVAVGLKWRVLDDHQLLGDFAVLPVFKFASASSTFGSGEPDIGITLISSHQVNGVAVDLNAALTRTSVGSSSASNSALWTASFGFPVAGRLSWAAELFGYPTIDGSKTPSTVSFLTGPTFLVVPELGLDAGIIAPLNNGAPAALYAGLVWNVGRLFGSASASPLATVAPHRLLHR